MTRTIQPTQRSLILLSFAAIYFIWGSTYLFNYFAIQDIEELITQQSILAALLMLAGVFFINSRLQSKGKPPVAGSGKRLVVR